LSILGLDIGTLRIGASGSNEARIATPLETIPGRPRKAALARVVELVEERGVETIVVGLPLELDGTEGIAVRKIRRFTASIAGALPEMPIVEWDERLTSVAAESSLIESGMRRKARKQVIDQVAAVLILQGYLESLGHDGH
jgi:putative Holliday junction resolvase